MLNSINVFLGFLSQLGKNYGGSCDEEDLAY